MARILLADDDALARDLLARTLEGDAHEVHQSGDGGEALARLREESGRFDILVSDVDMPVLDGVSLADRARMLYPGLRVVLVSGFPEELERARDPANRRLSVLSKPFTLDQIRSAVRTLLE